MIYVKNGNFTVAYKTKGGIKESVYYNKPFIRLTRPSFAQADILEPYKKYDRPNRLAGKLRAKTCELCGAKCNDVEIHQVKRLKDLKGQTEWEAVMLKTDVKRWRCVLRVIVRFTQKTDFVSLWHMESRVHREVPARFGRECPSELLTS